MDELKANFASNLIRLRTGAGLTQTALGEKLHYTDKAVSQWERAESVPDAYVLTELGKLFGVTVDQLLSPNAHWAPPPTLATETETYSRQFIILCTIAAIWTLCMVEFVVVWIVLGTIQWIVFVAAVPLSLIVLLVFNCLWFKGRGNMFIVMALASRQIVAVEDTDSVIQTGVRVVILEVDACAFIGGNHAFESDLDPIVLLYVAPELLERELHCIPVVEVRILLPGVDVQLLLLGIVQRSRCDVAVAVVRRG